MIYSINSKKKVLNVTMSMTQAFDLSCIRLSINLIAGYYRYKGVEIYKSSIYMLNKTLK